MHVLRSKSAELELVLLAVLWGYGFIANAQAFDAGFTPMLVIFLRFFVGALVMAAASRKALLKITWKQIKLGAVSALLLFASFALQSTGLLYTTPSTNAFLCSTGVVFVPFLVWVTSRVRPPLRAFVGSLLCIVGVFLLTASGSGISNFGLGEMLTLLSAVFFGSQIVYIGHISSMFEAKTFNFIQMFIVSLIALFGFLLFEMGNLEAIQWSLALPSTLYLGIFSTGVCYFLQLHAQQKTTSTKAAIIMSCESLFGTVFSVLIGYDKLTPNLFVGGAVILLSVLTVEIDLTALLKNKAAQNSDNN